MTWKLPGVCHNTEGPISGAQTRNELPRLANGETQNEGLPPALLSFFIFYLGAVYFFMIATSVRSQCQLPLFKNSCLDPQEPLTSQRRLLLELHHDQTKEQVPATESSGSQTCATYIDQWFAVGISQARLASENVWILAVYWWSKN